MTLDSIAELLSPEDPEMCEEDIDYSVTSTQLIACKQALITFPASEEKLHITSKVVTCLLRKEMLSEAATLLKMAERDTDALCMPPSSPAFRVKNYLVSHSIFEEAVIETETDPSFFLRKAVQAAEECEGVIDNQELALHLKSIKSACARLHQVRFRFKSQDPSIKAFSEELNSTENRAIRLLHRIRR